ncbi:MAG: TerB family tellurite resistance protein [Wenzhouxiangellaceae bacterium]|nr:TerB family tellurite resistance protein [Wenzhouxiangellaceae bacterium]
MPGLLEKLKTLVEPDAPEASETDPLPRALAVLMLELAATDAGIDDDERRVIEQAVRDRFGLDDEELRTLLNEAGEIQRNAHSLHEFTHALRTGLKPEQRADVVGWLWKVAWADSRLDRHEEHLVRRLADLLGVPHREFIRRKHQAGTS